MVTLLLPMKRRVSIRALITVDLPGATSSSSALALVQPHETRTLVMWTGWPVLFVRRNGWDTVGPRGTEPKSLLKSSNIASAHVPAAAGAATARPANKIKV